MVNSRPLVPGFLKKFDRWLLLNKPETWSARTHLVWFYTLLTAFVIAIIAFLVPDDPRTDSSAGGWTGLIMVVSLLGLVVWVIYLLRFNVFKRFGRTGPFGRLVTFLLYFAAVGALALLPFVQPRIESIRADMTYSHQELLNDLNEMNMAIAQIEYDRIDHDWTYDSVRLVPTMQESDQDGDTITTTVTGGVRKPAGKRVIGMNEVTLKERLRDADSVQKLSDSVYLFFHSPVYKFLDPYFYGGDERGEFSSTEIYNRVIKNYSPSDVARLKKRTQDIIKKYESDESYFYAEEENIYRQINFRYSLNMISTSMENIMERKQRWNDSNLSMFFRLWFYTTLIITLLVFTFRHSTAKVFFLSLLAAIILLILTSVFKVFSGSGYSVYTWMLIYFLAACIMSFLVLKTGSRSVWQGIGLNFFVWLLPFIPSILIVQYDDSREYSGVYEEDQRLYEIAEWVGPCLLVLFIATFIHTAYRKWYGAPDRQ